MSQASNRLLERSPEPLLIILSGPSGAGKDAVLEKLKKKCRLSHITTVTTRPRRPGEKDSIHYHFVSPDEFQQLIKDNALLEHAQVYGNWYGVPRKPVKESIAAGKDTIIKVDIQGAATIKKAVPQAVFIFLTPPSVEELVKRLKERNTESEDGLAHRVKKAHEEIKKLHLFDYIVFNRAGEMEQAVAEIKAIIAAEKCRVKPRKITL